MSSLDMKGSYELTTEKIDDAVTKESLGNYALGYIRDKTFYVKYVGRSDNNLNARLKEHVGEKDSYKRFKYSYATSPKAAFEKECKNYHDFGESEILDNEQHPDRPDDSDWKCPVCDIYG